MTRKELNQVYYLDKELKRCEENLAEIRASVQAKAQKITGMPFANTGEVSNPTEELAFRLLKAEEAVEGYKEALLIRKSRILEWITTLDDILLAQIVDYRCIRLMTWDAVAAKIGGGNTEETCRQYYCRKIPKK